MVEMHHIAVDERLFLSPGPTLELAFTLHRVAFRGKGFGIDQCHRSISFGICRSSAGVVSSDALIEICGVTDIEGIVGASQDVDVELHSSPRRIVFFFLLSVSAELNPLDRLRSKTMSKARTALLPFDSPRARSLRVRA
jgi:hypothetical protein